MSKTEAAICPRCKEPANVDIAIHLATGKKKRILTCDNCRYFEFTEVDDNE